jgi:hypothetical protein
MKEEDGAKRLVVGDGSFQEHLKLIHKKCLVVCTRHYWQWLKAYNLTDWTRCRRPWSSPSQSQLRLGKATIKQLNPQFSLRLNRIQTHTFEILPTLEVIVAGCTRSVVVPN